MLYCANILHKSSESISHYRHQHVISKNMSLHVGQVELQKGHVTNWLIGWIIDGKSPSCSLTLSGWGCCVGVGYNMRYIVYMAAQDIFRCRGCKCKLYIGFSLYSTGTQTLLPWVGLRYFICITSKGKHVALQIPTCDIKKHFSTCRTSSMQKGPHG